MIIYPIMKLVDFSDGRREPVAAYTTYEGAEKAIAASGQQRTVRCWYGNEEMYTIEKYMVKD